MSCAVCVRSSHKKPDSNKYLLHNVNNPFDLLIRIDFEHFARFLRFCTVSVHMKRIAPTNSCDHKIPRIYEDCKKFTIITCTRLVVELQKSGSN